MTELTPLLDVQARWAYSEIIDSKHADCYNGIPGIEALRNKRKSGMPFTELPPADRSCLALVWETVRSPMAIYVAGISHFRQINLTRKQLAGLYVPPVISHALKGQCATFKAFMNLPPAPQGDARDAVAPPDGYQASLDPLTIGHCDNALALIDGCHRAVVFWKSAPEGSVVSAYVPIKRASSNARTGWADDILKILQ